MRSSFYVFAVDLVGEGIDGVLDAVSAAGGDGITLAAVYHEASDYLPHNPRFKIHYTPPGVCFVPEPQRYPSGLPVPDLFPVCEGRDILAEACAAADERGMAVDAWMVMLHYDGQPGRAGLVHNAFGDPYQTLLCPAATVSRDYMLALVADVSRYGVRSIVTEGLHCFPADHGFHHERRFAPLGPVPSFLLSLCFCDDCRSAARAEGVDAEALAAWVRETVERDPASPDPLERAQIERLADGAMGRYLRLRERHVMSLIAECAAVASAQGVAFRFLDPSAAFAGWATGMPTGPLGVETAWTLGIDLASIEDGYGWTVAAYAADPARIEAELRAYRELLPAERVDVILRPMPPDGSDEQNLVRKLDVLRSLGISSVGYYHYGISERSYVEMVGRAHARAGA